MNYYYGFGKIYSFISNDDIRSAYNVLNETDAQTVSLKSIIFPLVLSAVLLLTSFGILPSEVASKISRNVKVKNYATNGKQ